MEMQFALADLLVLSQNRLLNPVLKEGCRNLPMALLMPDSA